MNTSDIEVNTRTEAIPVPGSSLPPSRTTYAIPPAGRSSFVPLLLIVLALAGWLGFQATQLAMESHQLALADTATQPQEQAATKLRASLDAIATGTAKLASEGNANARAIVDELRRRGVTIKPPGTPAPK